jgi:hypothetical protein
MKRSLLLLPFVLVACGPPYGRRVPDHLVARLPYETRVELLEAENALALAIDRVDTARSDIERNRDGIRRARARLDAANQEVGRAANPTDREVAQLARAEAEARVEALRAGQELAVRQTELEELALRCAWATYEQARLEAARKAKVEGSESLRPEDFQAQTKACEAEVAERRKGLAEPEKRLAGVRARWEEAKQALARKTFDARASPFVE